MSFKAIAFGYFDDVETDPENPAYGIPGYGITTSIQDTYFLFYPAIVPAPPADKNAVIAENSDIIYSVDPDNMKRILAWVPYGVPGFYIDPPSVDGTLAPFINRLAFRNNKLYVATTKGLYYADQIGSDLISSVSFIPGTYGWDIKHLFITSTGRVYCAGTSGGSVVGPNGITGSKAQFAVLNSDHTIAVSYSNTKLLNGSAVAWSVNRNSMVVKEGAGSNGNDLVIIKPTTGLNLYVNTTSGIGNFSMLGTTSNSAEFTTGQNIARIYLSTTGRIFAFGSVSGSLKVTYSDDAVTWNISNTNGLPYVGADHVLFGTFDSFSPSANIIKNYTANGVEQHVSYDNGETFTQLSLTAYENEVIEQAYAVSYYVPPAAPSNTAPTDITLSASSISESAASGSTVGTLSATDAEGGAMTFSLVSGAGSTDNASFVIDGNALKTAVALDYETKSSYSIRVRATDSGSLTYEEQMTITVLNNTADDPVALVSAQLPILASGKTVASIAVDPRVVAVTLGGQALSQGSVIRNTVSGQKFMKSAGGVNAFVAIELTPKAAWSWSASANAAWEILQGF